MISKAREAELERQRNKILRMRKREDIECVFVILFCVAVFVVFGVGLFHKCPDTKYHFTIVDKWESERLGSTQYNIKVFVETENADPWQGKAKEMQIKKVDHTFYQRLDIGDSWVGKQRYLDRYF